jgi:hypothetical protein
MKKILIRIINYGISYQLAAGDAGMLLHIINGQITMCRKFSLLVGPYFQCYV